MLGDGYFVAYKISAKLFAHKFTWNSLYDSGTPEQDFAQMVFENLIPAGVHQAAKDDRIAFTSIEGWPGDFVAAVGEYNEGTSTRRAGIFVGPEFGTITRGDLIAAAREALDARFDTLIACGFNFEAHTSELAKLGPLPQQLFRQTER